MSKYILFNYFKNIHYFILFLSFFSNMQLCPEILHSNSCDHQDFFTCTNSRICFYAFWNSTSAQFNN